MLFRSWLYDVCGRLDIPTFTLRIGDSSLGEKRIEIQTTKYKLGQNNRVRLVLEDQRLLELARAQVKAKIDQELGQESTQRLEAKFESSSDDSSSEESDSSSSENDSDLSNRELEGNLINKNISGKDTVIDVTEKRLPIRQHPKKVPGQKY